MQLSRSYHCSSIQYSSLLSVGLLIKHQPIDIFCVFNCILHVVHHILLCKLAIVSFYLHTHRHCDLMAQQTCLCEGCSGCYGTVTQPCGENLGKQREKKDASRCHFCWPYCEAFASLHPVVNTQTAGAPPPPPLLSAGSVSSHDDKLPALMAQLQAVMRKLDQLQAQLDRIEGAMGNNQSDWRNNWDGSRTWSARADEWSDWEWYWYGWDGS